MLLLLLLLLTGRPAKSMRDVSFSSSMMQSTHLSGISYCDDKGLFRQLYSQIVVFLLCKKIMSQKFGLIIIAIIQSLK